MTSEVVFRDVTKNFGDVRALDNLSLAFRSSKMTAVIGPSGSGKSTLLQHINGLLRPDTGMVSVFGKPVDYDRLTSLRRRIGYAVQGSGLFPHLSAARNIGILAGLEGWPKSQVNSRVEELLALVDLPADYASKFPHELSGGQQQRVGLCRAMVLDPPILLLDEAFGALDPVTRAEIHQEVLKLQRLQARTIILVTHDLREALKLADDIVLLNQGKLVQHAAARELLKNPATEFVNDFVHAQLSDSVETEFPVVSGQ